MIATIVEDDVVEKAKKKLSANITTFLRRVTLDEWAVVACIASGSLMTLYGPLAAGTGGNQATTAEDSDDGMGSAEDRFREGMLRGVFGTVAIAAFRSASQ